MTCSQWIRGDVLGPVLISSINRLKSNYFPVTFPDRLARHILVELARQFQS